MFTEKNIPKLIIFTPIIAVILIAISTIYIFIETQNNYFEEESIRLETEFIQKQKRLLKKEINTITNYITHQESIYTNKAIEKVELTLEVVFFENIHSLSQEPGPGVSGLDAW